jgi:hypothetical protein
MDTLAAVTLAVLTWSQGQEIDLAGYKVYQSNVPGQYGQAVATLGKTPTYTSEIAREATEKIVYFAVTAYDTSGNESPKSIEISKVIPALPVPVPPGITILSSNESKIVVEAKKTDCAKITTSTAGSTALVSKRTITCVK